MSVPKKKKSSHKSNNSFIDKPIYIHNKSRGALFVTDQDMQDSNYMVQTNPNKNNGMDFKPFNEYCWKILKFSSLGNFCYIYNFKHGFLFAANDDIENRDPIVKCDPSVTPDQVSEEKKGNVRVFPALDSQYLWSIQEKENGYYHIKNKKYGLMFSDDELSTNNNIVEVCPENKHTDDKSLWSIQPIEWMSSLSGNKLLSELSIPGTHESCALYDWECCFGFIGTESNAKCQDWILIVQLMAGVRSLDIRLKKLPNNTLQAWHGDRPNFSVDQLIPFDSIVDICKTFLSLFKNETIIMSIKKEDGVDIGSLIQQKIDEDRTLWYTKNSIPLLQDVRGKIVLLRRFDGSTLGIDLFTNWKNNDPDFCIPPETEYQIDEKDKEIFFIQDKYDCEGDKEAAKKEKWRVVKSMLNKCNADSSSKHWYLSFASGYYKVTYNPAQKITDYFGSETDVPDIKVISNKVNPELASYLPTINRCGTLMVDFINDDIIQKIIRLNK